MASVIDTRECPQYHGVADSRYNCRTYEDWLQCLVCGYSAWVVNLRDRKGDPGRFKLTKDGRIIQRFYERKGYGAYYLTSKQGAGQFGGISKRHLNDASKMIAKFKRICAERDVDPTASYLTKWDEGKKNALLFLP